MFSSWRIFSIARDFVKLFRIELNFFRNKIGIASNSHDVINCDKPYIHE